VQRGVGPTKGHHVGLRVWARLAFAMQHCMGRPVACSCALCLLGVFSGMRAACRSVRGNNIGGELPAQYSALTNLQALCVATF
jgi:hypothetical protein